MTQDPITTRFIEVFEWLKDQGRVRSARQFALSIDTYPQSFNDIRKGRREATLQMIQNLTKEHNINSHYLLTGQGSIERNDINGVSTAPMIRVRFLQVHQFGAYASAVSHDNIDEFNCSEWALPSELLGTQIQLAIQCDTDRLSSSISKGDILFSRKMPKEAWKSNLSSKRVYVIGLSDNVIIVRISDNDNKGIYISQDDRELPHFLSFEEINEIWCPISKLTNNVLQSDHDHVDNNKLDHISQTLEDQHRSIDALKNTIQRLTQEGALQPQF